MEVANLTATVSADTTKLKSGLAEADSSVKSTKENVESAEKATESLSSKFSEFGENLKSVGEALNEHVTEPLKEFAIEAIKSASEFEEAMDKVRSATDASAEEFEQYTQQVKDLTSIVPQSAKELADALLPIVTAGFKSSDAMTVLENSAKAAALGLGSTSGIAATVAGALNNYGLHADQAAHFTDVLASVARQGGTTIDALKPIFDKVGPAAHTLGLSIDQAAASLMALGNAGLGADEAGALLRDSFSALAKPSAQVKSSLAAVHLSVKALKNALNKDGIVGALDLLRDRMHGNSAEMEKVVPGISKLTNAMGAAKDSTGGYAESLKSISDASGKVAKDFAEASGKFTMQVALLKNKFETLRTEIGAELLPKLTPLVKWFSETIPPAIQKVIDGFKTLSPSVQSASIAFAVGVAAAGPLIAALGAIVVGAIAIGPELLAIGAAITVAFGLVAAVVAPNLESIKNAVTRALDFIKQFWTDHGQQILQIAQSVWNGIKTAVTTVVTPIKDFIVEQFGAVVQWFKDNWPLIKETVERYLKLIGVAIQGFVTLVEHLWKEHGQRVTEVVSNLWGVVTEIVGGAIKQIENTVKFILQIINGHWSDAYKTLQKISDDAWNEVISIFKKGGNALIAFLNLISETFDDIFWSVVKSALKMGENIINGIIQGIKNRAETLKATLKNVVGGAIDVTNVLLKINSPSLVFASIGESIIEGLVKGIDDSSGSLIEEMGKVNDLVTAPLNSTALTVAHEAAQSISPNAGAASDDQSGLGLHYKDLISGAESAFQKGFTDLVQKGWKSALLTMITDFGNAVEQMVTKALAAKLTKALFGSTDDSGNSDGGGLLGGIFGSSDSSDDGGGIGGFLSGILSGLFTHRATGGPVSAGAAYLVGENGPEIFQPGASGVIIPNDQTGAGGTDRRLVQHNHFYVQSSNGVIAPQSQLQIADRVRAAAEFAVARG